MAKKKYPDNRVVVLTRLLPEQARTIASLAKAASKSRSRYVADILAQVLAGEVLLASNDVAPISPNRFEDSKIGYAQLATRISPEVATHLDRLHELTGYTKRTLVEHAILSLNAPSPRRAAEKTTTDPTAADATAA